jgi:hypothetical protein
MRARTVWLHGLCIGLLLMLGCRADVLAQASTPVPTPPAVVTAPPTNTASESAIHGGHSHPARSQADGVADAECIPGDG